MNKKKFCPACGVSWSMEAVKFNECDSCGYPHNQDDEKEVDILTGTGEPDEDTEYLFDDDDEYYEF